MQSTRDEEIYASLKDLNPLKASGPDGFHAVFFQKSWEMVKELVTGFVRKILTGKESLSQMSEAMIVLIPKEDNTSKYHNSVQ